MAFMEKTDYYFPEKVSRTDVQVVDTHSVILKKAARHEFNYDDVEFFFDEPPSKGA
ncbi:hypothetical protein [Amphritea opalescens]|uniref:hypothetical protein n=1 Tax=Amphritea opalescens TaxID=2490544 RepID=UPI0013DEECFE|nr:hypothetical protein [Amphritea opalescens]